MATTAQRLDEGYVSTIDFLHEREISNQLYDKRNENLIIDFFRETGREERTTQTEYHHFENDFIYNNVEVLSVTGGGVGLPVVVTLALTNHTNGKSFPKVSNIVMFQDKKQGYVTAKSEAVPTAHTITIQPIDITEDILASVVIGQLIAFISSAFAEGTGQPEGQVTAPLKFDNICQIIKTDHKVTGTEATNTMEFTFEGKNYYYYKSEHDAYLRHMMDCDFAMIFSQKSNGLLDANGEPVRTTEGIRHSILNHGNTYAAPITALTDIDDIVKILDKQRGSMENLWLAGINQDLNIDNVLINQTINGGISYNTFGEGDQKQKGIDLGFSTFVKGSYVFHKKKLTEFNHPNVTGSTGHTWPDSGMIIPTDSGTDAKSSKTIESIKLRYKASPEHDRRFRHWTTGASSKLGKTDVDELNLHYLSEKGLEMFGLHRYILVE